MPRIYPVSLRLAGTIADSILPALQRHDPALVRQLRRAVTSIPLNIAEGWGSQGGNRRARFSTAPGSAREVRGVIDASLAMRYLGSVRPDLLAACRVLKTSCSSVRPGWAKATSPRPSR